MKLFKYIQHGVEPFELSLVVMGVADEDTHRHGRCCGVAINCSRFRGYELIEFARHVDFGCTFRLHWKFLLWRFRFFYFAQSFYTNPVLGLPGQFKLFNWLYLHLSME